jgi:hypothetical protein
MSVTVVSVDVDRRQITLRGPEGQTAVYKVSDEVRRLDDIKAGDTLKVDYRVTALAELREPTAEERDNPVAVSEGLDRAPVEGPPAAVIHRAVRVVARIEALDRPAQNFTVKGPNRGDVGVHVDDPAAFAAIRVGQAIVVKFAETLKVMVEPGGGDTGNAPRSVILLRGVAAGVKVSLSVVAVDTEHRLITLRGPEGNEAVYQVGDAVKRLGEIKAGDTLTADYQVAAIAELRKPTAEELNNPLVVTKGFGRAPSEAPPAAAFERSVRVVAKIEALDRPDQTLMLKCPLQGTVAVHVDNDPVFVTLRVGQAIVASFTETLTLMIEPGQK